MGKRLEILDHVFGCFTAVKKAESRKTKSGATVGYWIVRCECGTSKEMRVQALVNRHHFNCGKSCHLRPSAPTLVNCKLCGCEYAIRRDSLTKKRKLNSSEFNHWCRKCAGLHAASFVVGKPAHNRLADGVAAFNSLYGSYKRNAKVSSKVPFELTKEQFMEITKRNCDYCGGPPVSERAGDALRTRGKDSGRYVYNGIDRKDSGKGYTVENTVPCCSKCNYMKSNMPLDEFISRVEKIHKHLSCVPPRSGNRVFMP